MNKINEILNTMDYGPAPEDTGVVRDWLKRHEAGFGHFIDGQFTAPGQTFAVSNPAGDANAVQRGPETGLGEKRNQRRAGRLGHAVLPRKIGTPRPAASGRRMPERLRCSAI